MLLKMHGETNRNLSELTGELKEALPPDDKQLIKYTTTTRHKKPITLIIIKNDFLPKESSSDYEEIEEELDADIEIPGIILKKLEKD